MGPALGRGVGFRAAGGCGAEGATCAHLGDASDSWPSRVACSVKKMMQSPC